MKKPINEVLTPAPKKGGREVDGAGRQGEGKGRRANARDQHKVASTAEVPGRG
jgi:hypothetical protein